MESLEVAISFSWSPRLVQSSPNQLLSDLAYLMIAGLCTLTLNAPTPQNSQTHSNNSLATAEELFQCV